MISRKTKQRANIPNLYFVFSREYQYLPLNKFIREQRVRHLLYS